MLITIIGAGSGIGAAVSKLFGSKGYNIALIARNEEKLIAEVKELEALGIKAMYAVGDAGNEASLYAALEKISHEFGHADMILYNAYSRYLKKVEDEYWESIIQQLTVNVVGAFSLLKKVLPFCKKQNKGKLFFTGGGLAMYPEPSLAGLSMGKVALRNLITGTAKSVEGTNIHIATLTITGYINDNDAKYNSTAIAEQYWNLFNQKEGEFESEIIY